MSERQKIEVVDVHWLCCADHQQQKAVTVTGQPVRQLDHVILGHVTVLDLACVIDKKMSGSQSFAVPRPHLPLLCMYCGILDKRQIKRKDSYYIKIIN